MPRGRGRLSSCGGGGRGNRFWRNDRVVRLLTGVAGLSLTAVGVLLSAGVELWWWLVHPEWTRPELVWSCWPVIVGAAGSACAGVALLTVASAAAKA